MVYCSKCGTTNEDTAEYCVKCGAKLDMPTKKSWDKQVEEWGEDFGRRAEEWGKGFGKQAEAEFSKFSQGGIFLGLSILVIGVVITIVGFLSLSGIDLWSSFWPIMIVILGILLFGGAAYSLIRSR